MSNKPESSDKPEYFWENVLDQALAGEADKLIEEQHARLAQEPDDPRPYFHLGVLYYMRGQVEEAIAMHQQALARDPAFALAHQHLGQICIVLGDHEKAWAHAHAAAKLGNTVLLDMLTRYPKITKPPE